MTAPPAVSTPAPAPRTALWFAAGFSTATAVAAGVVAGSSLGLYFAPLALVGAFLPFLLLAETRLRRRLEVAAVAALPILIAWLAADSVSPLAARIACCFVLLAYTLFLIGLSLALHRLVPSPAAPLAVILHLLLITWPAWLSPWLSSGSILVTPLVPAHPLFTLNAALPHFGLWTEHAALMYGLTSLGQHVPYAFPSHPWWSALGHATVGVALLFASRIARPRAI